MPKTAAIAANRIVSSKATGTNIGQLRYGRPPMFSGYAMEAFYGWYSANMYEQFMVKNRIWSGPYAWSYWALIFCNGLIPQTLWIKRLRTNTTWLFIMALIVSVGMWLERFVIIVTSLHRDFLPSSWDMYYPTFWDYSTFLGTVGLFITLMFLFVRVLPMISIFEMRTLVPDTKPDDSGARRDDSGARLDDTSRARLQPSKDHSR